MNDVDDLRGAFGRIVDDLRPDASLPAASLARGRRLRRRRQAVASLGAIAVASVVAVAAVAPLGGLCGPPPRFGDGNGGGGAPRFLRRGGFQKRPRDWRR